jgi:3-hydroxyacyl-CoA dehydrogenase
MNSQLSRNINRGIKNFSVIGSGLMGAGIAQVGAQTGHNVVLYDISDAALDKARASIETSVKRVAKKMDQDKAESFIAETLSRIEMTSSMETTGANAELIVEAVVENLGLKQKLFADLEAASSATCILATNTSSLPVSAIGADLKDKSKFGGLHFFNPVPMMKLLEVVKGDDTSDATFEAMLTWGQAMGKTTVKCIDTPGFIVNRLLVPYLMEAIRLVERGHASKEDVGKLLLFV